MYQNWIEVLSQVELFKDIKGEDLRNVLKCIKPQIKSYNKEELITIEQEPLTGVGIVLEGAVIICKETFAGDRVIISKLGASDLFGEVAAFANNKWPATVIADTKCTILFFPPDNIIGTCGKACIYHKQLIQNMLQIVASKALILNNKVDILSLKSIRKKISMYLLERYKLSRKLTFDIELNRNELADYLLVSRPSLSRELANMKKEGIIDFHLSSFKILDIKELQDTLI